MKYGMNLLLWSTDVTDEAWRPLLDAIAALGFDGVEVPIFGGAVSAYHRLGRTLDGLGLARTAVTVRQPDTNPISADASVRRRAVEDMDHVLACAAAMGAELVAGPNHIALGVHSGAPPTSEEWRRSVGCVREMAERARTHGVLLAIEPLNRFEEYLLNTAARGVQFVREVGHPSCRLMYDTFHAHIEEQDVRNALLTASDLLGHVHLSESDRGVPGRGQVNWAATSSALREVGYDGWLTIEAFGTRLPELAAATCVWRRTFEDEHELAREGLAFVRGRFPAAQTSSGV